MSDIDHLKAFVAAVDMGSFSAAARHLRKAQSAVSASVANLEIDTGLELFDRSGHKPSLTDEGQSLLPYARSVLLGQRELLAKAASLSSGTEDQLNLVIETHIVRHPLVSVLQGFKDRFPDVILRIDVRDPASVADMLKRGESDLGLMLERESYPQGFQFRGIGYIPFLFVCAPSHPLAALPHVRHKDLRQYCKIQPYLSPTGSISMDESDHVPLFWEVADPETARLLAEAGLGWGLLPAQHCWPALKKGSLVSLQSPFQQNENLEGLDLVWTERRRLGPAGDWLRRALMALDPAVWRQENT